MPLSDDNSLNPVIEKANEMTPVAHAVGHKKNESLSAVPLKVSEVEDA